MKLKAVSGIMLTLLLIGMLALAFNVQTVKVVADPQAATVFVDPPTVKGAVVGENVTVNINVSNITDLYGWQAGVTFNPDVLNCTGYYEGEFLNRSVNRPINPAIKTIWLNQTPPWDNTKGVAYFHGCCLLGPVPGVSGSGQLGYLTFEVIGTEVSDLHLTDVILADPNAEGIQHEVADTFTVSWGGVDYSVEIMSNLTGIWGEPASGLFDHVFSPEEKTVTFDVTTPYDNFYEVTIPKTILSCDNLSDWTIEVDGEQISFVATESPTDTSLYFTYHNSTHKVEITGTVLGKLAVDLNDDGTVDIFDVVTLARAFGSEPGDPNWNQIADVNNNDVVDIHDVVLVAIHFGQTYP